MLKELSVEDKTFFFECAVKGDVIEYLLFDSNKNWTAVKTQEQVLQTLQLLNKRIQYDLSTAYDTLQNAQPESANWVESDAGTDQLKDRVLKLKYRVKGCPFNFEWHLRKQDNTLNIPLPVNEVASIVDSLPTQIEELLDVLRRKEDEINQYRLEYGSLRRSTLATSAFDVDKFRELYAAMDMKVKILQKMIARWRAEHGETVPTQSAEVPTRKHCSPVNAIKTEAPATSSASGRNNVQDSPRNRKRKTMQEKKAQMTRTLNSRRQKLEYESQSQSLSESDKLPDINEVIEAPKNTVSVEKAADNTKNNEKKDVNHGKKKISTPAKNLVSSIARTEPNLIVKGTSETVKEVASKNKVSPRVSERPNTRLRRRQFDVHENNSSELTIIDIPSQSVVFSVDEEGGSQKTNGVTSAIGIATNTNVKNEYSPNAQKLSKPQVEEKVQLPNNLSAYVDSVLSQLDLFDKELKAQFNSARIDS